jgi:hypothetical protein
MKRAGLGLLCLFFLMPTVALAQESSLNSITPSSFYSFELEQTATLHGVDLFGDFGGEPTQENILAYTHVVVDGPAGTFTEDLSGGFRQPDTLNDTIYIAIPDSTLFVEGHYSVTILATDDVGVRSIGPVFYDVVARPIQQNPLIGVPDAVFADATSAAGANVMFEVTGVSFVDPAPVITCDHQSGDLFAIGVTTVHCTATDSFGSASGNFPVFVLDSGAPVVTVPADIVVSSANPVVTFTVTAHDVIDGDVTVSCTPASGSTFEIGSTEVVCLAYDSQANVGTGTFTVTVSAGPVLTLPADITAEATSPAGAAVSYTVTATDNATIVCTPASGSTFALGTTTVDCTATASTGSTSGSFHVTVVDTTPPTIVSITASPNNIWPDNHKMVDVTLSVILSDLVDANPTAHIVSVTANQPINAGGDGNTNGDYVITGPLTLQLRAERTGSADRTYTITIAASDSTGNISYSTVTVSVSQTNNSNAISTPPSQGTRGRAVRP